MLTVLTAADDSLHPAPPDDPSWTETMWLAFAVPSRHLSGVIYTVLRPNRDVGWLGVWMWDDTAHAETDILYFQSYPHLPMPTNVADMELPCGFRQEVLEPGHRYRVSYDDQAELRLDLTFASMHEPIGREFDGGIAGSNQLGRVAGEITFNQEQVPVDCFEFRGRSWSSRPDARMVLRPDEAGSLLCHADTYATSPTTAFFVSSMGNLERTSVLSGHLLRDGEMHSITEGERVVERDPVRGCPLRVVVEATDEADRTLRATGTCVNQLLMATIPGVPFPLWVGGTNWIIDGEPAWGQDQDVPIGRPTPLLAHPAP